MSRSVSVSDLVSVSTNIPLLRDLMWCPYHAWAVQYMFNQVIRLHMLFSFIVHFIGIICGTIMDNNPKMVPFLFQYLSHNVFLMAIFSLQQPWRTCFFQVQFTHSIVSFGALFAVDLFDVVLFRFPFSHSCTSCYKTMNYYLKNRMYFFTIAGYWDFLVLLIFRERKET